MIDASHVRQSEEVCTAFLEPWFDSDWSAQVPDLGISIAQVVAHMAEGCLWYAIDLSAGGTDLTTVEHRVKDDHEPQLMAKTLTTYASMLATIVDASPSTSRGIHPMGLADPSGFAAMGCDEMLIHTNDMAQAFGADFDPPAELASAVLARLFPWVSDASTAGLATDDPWATLRWANGRIALGDRARLTSWRWHCAPLAEWDGTNPNET